jgi:transcriptional regulator with XRE-family HTH domain
MAGLKPTAADVALGRRLSEARRVASLTQRQMGDALGFSAAQWQKYEKGTNRISATCLPVIARLTGKPLAWFFGDGTAAEPALSADEKAELEDQVLGAVSRIVERRRAAQAEARA